MGFLSFSVYSTFRAAHLPRPVSCRTPLPTWAFNLFLIKAGGWRHASQESSFLTNAVTFRPLLLRADKSLLFDGFLRQQHQPTIPMLEMARLWFPSWEQIPLCPSLFCVNPQRGSNASALWLELCLFSPQSTHISSLVRGGSDLVLGKCLCSPCPGKRGHTVPSIQILCLVCHQRSQQAEDSGLLHVSLCPPSSRRHMSNCLRVSLKLPHQTWRSGSGLPPQANRGKLGCQGLIYPVSFTGNLILKLFH